MNWTLEVVVVPVSDVDRAKEFYAQQLGFNVDHDTDIGKGNRVVQLTPPGSGCSIVVGSGVVPHMPPGSLQGLQLVVPDIHKARAQLGQMHRMSLHYPSRRRLAGEGRLPDR